jgi:hypothetical protein
MELAQHLHRRVQAHDRVPEGVKLPRQLAGSRSDVKERARPTAGYLAKSFIGMPGRARS